MLQLHFRRSGVLKVTYSKKYIVETAGSGVIGLRDNLNVVVRTCSIAAEDNKRRVD